MRKRTVKAPAAPQALPVAVLRDALLTEWRWTPAQVQDLIQRVRQLAARERDP